jgi:hypothetical protein
MKSANIPLGLSAAHRKEKILEIIDQGPARGTIEIVFEQLDQSGIVKSRSLVWRHGEFDNATSPRRIRALVDKIDREIEMLSRQRDRSSSIVTVTVTNRGLPV